MFSSPQTNMEVLNASGIAPVSTLHPAKRLSLPKLPKFPPPKNLEFRELVSRSIGGGLSVLSSVLSGVGLANALTYEEALQQSVSSGDSPNFDFNGLLDGVVGFATENPLVIGGGALALAVPLVLSNIFGKPKKGYGVESAKIAYARLAEDQDVQLLDIREGKEFKESGSPEVRGLKKKAVSIAYRGDDKNGFLKKLALKFKDPSNTTLVILDRFDGNSELVAELVTVNGFKASYAIKDGAEGTRGWKNSGLPWSAPKKSLAVDFGGLQDALSGVLGEGSDGLPVTLGLAAATGLGVLALSEIETVLQLLGSAAIIQFATKKLLFAEDRKATLRQVDEFLNTKVAPKELADEIKMIGKALLPISTTARPTLPAPVEEPATTMAAKTHMEPKVEEVAEEPPQEVNSVPKAEIEPETKPAQPRPLSPYPYYPDLKPPSSPAPSRP